MTELLIFTFKFFLQVYYTNYNSAVRRVRRWDYVGLLISWYFTKSLILI